MTAVLPIGDLLPKDTHGNFVNPCATALIVPPWLAVVDEIQEAYLSRLGDHLHSIYVRGSVARGAAITGISDVDTFAVISSSRWKIDSSWTTEVQRNLNKKYPFQTGVEFQFVTLEEALDPGNWGSIGFVIKNLSTCTWGEDLAGHFEPYRPGQYLVESIRDIEGNLKKFRFASAQRTGDKARTRKICQWLMKNIVRTGFLLVAEREQAYTRDLYPSYVAFKNHYAEQAELMKVALEWSIEPTDDMRELTEFVDVFGEWIVMTVLEKYPN